jgi:hypothetical protein
LAPHLGESYLQLEQLQELKRKVEEDRFQLAQLRATIEGERGNRNIEAARFRARDVQRRICNDGYDERLPPFAWASQNVTVATILLQGMLELFALEVRRAHEELWVLLDWATVQQAESSTSRQHESALLAQPKREGSIHPEPQKEEDRLPHAQEHGDGEAEGGRCLPRLSSSLRRLLRQQRRLESVSRAPVAMSF